MHAIVFRVMQFFIFLFIANLAYAFTVPFQNFYLNSNQTLQATYSFGNFSVIFCFANNTQNNGVITWPYRGNRPNSVLPIFLRVNDRFSGQPADPNGIITIYNNTPNSLDIGCVFAY